MNLSTWHTNVLNKFQNRIIPTAIQTGMELRPATACWPACLAKLLQDPFMISYFRVSVTIFLSGVSSLPLRIIKLAQCYNDNLSNTRVAATLAILLQRKSLAGSHILFHRQISFLRIIFYLAKRKIFQEVLYVAILFLIFNTPSYNY
jgi:hypothetical protein